MKARGVPTKDFTVRLPEELAEVLRNYAFVSNLSVNEIFKRAVSDYLQTHGS